MISVIIPIYNIAEYLPACLESLIKQENSDFEVIMVNDGSSDRSEEICRQYETKDKRFRLFNKPNGGVSSARNLGMRHAQGKWIAFVDGDDIVDSKYLCLPDATEGIDVIEKSYYIKSNEKVLLSKEIKDDSIIETNKDFLRYYSEFIQANSLTLGNKIIRRNVIGNQFFDEKKAMGEDFLFFLSIISRVQRYYLMSQGSYYYLKRDTSASRTAEADRSRGIKSTFENLESVREITCSNGAKALGANIVYTRYLPSLLSLHNYLSLREWYRVFILWISFFCADKTLMAKHQRRNTLVGFPKAIINTIRSNFLGEKLSQRVEC